MSYLGIDIGSSQVKAVAYSSSGEVRCESRRQYPTISTQATFAELDSNEVIAKALEVIREVAGKLPLDPVQALAISSQGEAFTPTDADGNILADAMISSDMRAGSELDDFAQILAPSRLYQITGHTPSAMFSLYKLLWLKRHRRDIFHSAAHFLCFEDLLCAKLGVAPAMGYSLAARTMLFDVRQNQWSQTICDAVGIQIAQLARALPSGAIAGIIPAAIAAKLHLAPRTAIVAGGHDQVLGALGCGAHLPAQAMYAAGSVECITPIFDRLRLDQSLEKSNLCCYPSALPNFFSTVAYSLTGSNLLQYFMENYCREWSCDADSYQKLIAEMPDNISNLLVLPYFTPSGTPDFDAVTPGTVYGWRLTTSRGELLKGLLEGVTFEMRRNLDLLTRSGIRIRELIATGGGNRSLPLLKLKSNILNRPIHLTDIKESGCRGAALLAQSATENKPVAQLENAFPKIRQTILPSPEITAQYHQKYRQWKAFCKKIKTIPSHF